MGREVIRTAADGTAKVFRSINGAAAESGVPPTSLKRLLGGGGGTLREYTFKYAGETSNPVVAGAPASPGIAASEPAAEEPTDVGPVVPGDVADTSNAVPEENLAPEQESPEQSATNLFESLRTDDGRIITEMRTDGYVNATKMCQSAGKLWADFYRLESTALYLDALREDLEKEGPSIVRYHIIDLVQSSAGRYGGTWVHPDVAIHLAQWCSPYFAVQVSKLVNRYVRGKVTTEESRAAAEIVKKATEEAEIQSRKRKIELEMEEMAVTERKLALQKHALEMRKMQSDMELDVKEREMELESKKRKEELDAKEREIVIRENDASYKVNFYVSTFNGLGMELEASDRLLLKDMMRNTMAPPGGARQAAQSNAVVPHDETAPNNAEASRVLLPISDMYRRITQTTGNKAVWQAIGRYAAQVYRSMKGREPEKVERMIDGTTRSVAAYEGSDAVWMGPLIQAYASGALNGVPYKNVRFENGRVVF